MKYLLGLMLIVVTIALPACKTPGCAIGEKAAQVFATATANALAPCTHPELILADYNAFLEKIGVCKEPGVEEMVDPKTGAIADLVCPIAAKYAAEFLAQGIPSKWGCSATNAKDKVMTILTVGCEKLPF